MEMGSKDENVVISSKNSALRNLFCTWLGNASANGFNRLPNSKVHTKAFWIFIIVTAYAALTYHSYTLFLHYFSYPVSTEILPRNLATEMPDVTICRSGIFIKSNANFRGGPMPTELEGSSQYIWQHLYQTIENVDKQRYKLEYFQRGWLYEEFHNYSTQLVEYLLKCSYQGTLCGINYFKKFVHPIMLDCFTFQPPEREIYHKGGTLSLTLDSYLGTKQEKWIHGNGKIIVTLHAKGTIPDVLRHGDTILPGTKTKIHFSSKKIERESTPAKPCVKSFYYNYENMGRFVGTRDDAYRKYAQKEMVKKCKCECPFLMFRNTTKSKSNKNCFAIPKSMHKYQTMLHVFLQEKGVPLLGLAMVSPMNEKNKNDPNWVAYRKMDKQWKNNMERMRCHQELMRKLEKLYLKVKTARQCNKFLYNSFTTAEVGYANNEIVDVAEDMTILKKTLKEAEEYISKNNLTSLPLYPIMKTFVTFYLNTLRMVSRGGSVGKSTIEDAKKEVNSRLVQLDIIADDAPSDLIKESRSYPLSSFFSEFGGTLGLWMGASVISLCEVFELGHVLIAMVCVCMSKKSADEDAVDEEQEHNIDQEKAV